MNLEERNVWQQAAGDKDRNYVELCMRWGVILNGPGRYGAWPQCTQLLQESGWGPRKITDLSRFAVQMKEGDIVLLRLGTSDIFGVGILVGNYLWDECFGDVDGWDLQHIRRVHWVWRNGKDSDHPLLKAWDLKQGDTTQLLRLSGPVYEWLKELDLDEDVPLSLPPLPLNTKNIVSVQDVSEYLFDRGVASASIATLVDQMDDLQRIAKWYSRVNQKPSEHETVAYLVIPLLRTLGWTPQRMAVEWRSVDVALFETLPRSDDVLQVVVEAKKMSNSCLSALGQAAAYASTRSSCKRLIVTDGLRYGIYIKHTDDVFRLHAYMNIQRLQGVSSIYECAGAPEALWAMTPEWRGR